MPSFMVFKDGQKIGEMVGADPQKLQVCLIWLSGNIAWSLIKSVATARERRRKRVNWCRLSGV
jgi:hypothetical protein